jgi:hypothetical protein
LRAELDYVVPLGIPHSVFLGRVVAPGDPTWLDTDRELALAWQHNKRETCPGCGTRPDEWAEDEDAYLSDHVQCQGCLRLAEEQENNLDRDAQGKPQPGQHAFLRPNPTPLHARD